MQARPVLIALFGGLVFALLFSEPAVGTDGPYSSAVSDLLAVLIAITGVTIPLLISYLLIVSQDIRVDVSSLIEAYYAPQKITPEKLSTAAVHLGENRKRQNHGAEYRLLELLNLAALAKDQVDRKTREYAPFPNAVLEDLYRDREDEQDWFSFFFDHRCNRACVQFYVLALGVLAILCFIDLHQRFRGGPFLPWPALEEGLIGSLFVLNLSVYYQLAVFGQREAKVRRWVTSSMRIWCERAQGDLNDYLRDEESLRGEIEQVGQPAGIEMTRPAQDHPNRAQLWPASPSNVRPSQGPPFDDDDGSG